MLSTTKISNKIHREKCFIIILPTYNRVDLLERALKSIQNQDHKHWQCIIINDGSTDNTDKIASEYKKSDSRIHLLTQNNQGVNSARNTGIEFAQSNFNDFYFLFIDDDDYLHKECFKSASYSISSHKEFKWHGLNCIKISDKHKVSRIKNYGQNNYINDLMFGRNWRGDITSFIHESIVENHRYCQEIKNGEEWYFWSLLAEKNDCFISDIPGSYKDYLPSGLTNSGFNRDKTIQVIKLKLKMLTPLVGEKKMVHQLVTLAKNLYQQGDKKEARKLLIKVFKMKPLYIRQYPHWLKQLFH
jgi:glycosyltransferase involved in cell wall biosynthesis